MTKPQKNTLLCATLTIVLAALLIQGAAFAGQLDFSRPPSGNQSGGNNSAVPSQIGQAQQAIARAIAQVTVALSVNWAGKTHAVTAKALLGQANQELKLADTKISSNSNTNASANTGN